MSGKRVTSHVRMAGVAILALVLSACVMPGVGGQKVATPPVTTQPQAPAAPSALGSQAPAQLAATQAATPASVPVEAKYVGQMSLHPERGAAGTRTTARGTGLPANTTMNLLWYTVKGSWDIRGEEQEEYHGRVYTPITKSLGHHHGRRRQL